jgi:hypothetical protein
VLVDKIENLKWPAIIGSLCCEVIRPDMVGMPGSMSNAGAIGKPKSCPLGLFLWHLETFFSPDRINSVFTDVPTLHIEKPPHLTIPIAAILGCQLNDSGAKPFLLLIWKWLITLGGMILPYHSTCPALRHPKLSLDLDDSLSAPGRA